MSTHQAGVAVERAAAAAGPWGALSPEQRASALDRVAAELEAASDELLELAERETHLSPARLTSELARTTFQLRLLAREARAGWYLNATVDHPDDAWQPVPRPDLRRVRVPLGPVVVFAASNFPFAFSVAGGDTAAALAVGCPVLVKAHPGHPRLSHATARVVTNALGASGAPAGTFAVLVGDEAGRAALSHPATRAGAFTGSLVGGRALFDLAQGRPEPIPFFAEMGSVNPVVVTRAAAAHRLDEVVLGFVQSFTLGQGQFCTKPGILLLPAGTPSDELFADALNGPHERTPLLNDAIHAGYVRGLERLLAADGVSALRADDAATSSCPTPTLLATDAAAVLNDPALLDEVFGPASLVVRYRDEQELFEVLTALPGQLTATVQALGDEPELPGLLATMTQRAGRVIVNGWPTGVAVTYAMHHGGPYPATTSPAHTSVGTGSLSRFTRPVAYQNLPDHLLPPALQEANPLRIPRRVDGHTREA